MAENETRPKITWVSADTTQYTSWYSPAGSSCSLSTATVSVRRWALTSPGR